MVTKLDCDQRDRRPIEGKRNILITAALPYVNNVPHLGNIIGSTLSADVFARYCRGRGYNFLYICGTDEYGTATEARAKLEGVSPKELCDKYHKIHSDIYKWFDIKFDNFGRTSEPLHTKITQEIFQSVHSNGFTLEAETEQLFCEKCDKFLADRFVEGTCPIEGCGYTEARGDQCDACAKLLDATELIDPKCKVDGSRPVKKKSTHLYLDLPKLGEKHGEWFKEAHVKGDWSKNSTAITKTFVNATRPRCITRDLKWGIPVPLEGWEKKVFYVWFDAPIGYISITAGITSHWREWWQNPKNVQLYQFMGKDNVGFHSVVFPSCLLATGEDWTLVHHISSTEYLNYELQKFSKGRGIGVFGNDVQSTGIPSEIWRYYLLSIRPETSDSSFNLEDLATKTNNELFATVGNFVVRNVSLLTKYFESKLPACELNEQDLQFIANVNSELDKYHQLLEKVSIREGLKQAIFIGSLGNKYLRDNPVWDLWNTKPLKSAETVEEFEKRKEEGSKRAKTVVSVTINLCRLLGLILSPFVPGLSTKIFDQLNCNGDDLIPDSFTLELGKGHSIRKQLITQITDEKIKELRSAFLDKGKYRK